MRYSSALDYSDEGFRRLAGVKKRTFGKMAAVLTEAHARKKAQGGRPKRRRRYSGKKKRHTIKARAAVAKPSGRIICTAFGTGGGHGFRLFKNSLPLIHPSVEATTDTGYPGICKLYGKSRHPRKRSRKHPLAREDRRFNREVSRERILHEHAIGALKRFRILSERRRNRRKRFALRFNLIAGICNHEPQG